MSLRAGNMQQISGWALRCGIRSPHRASQQASVARQWGWMLPAMLMLAMPVSAAISAPERNEPQGWQWYNEPQDNTEPQAPAPKQKSASELKKAYQQATQEALDNAILNSSPDNFARFMRWQNFWTERAGKFSQSAKSAMLKYPELDYNLKYSHYNGTVKEQLSMDKQKEQAAIAKLASQYGIFFFYRGQMPLDNLAGSIIANFAKDNNISIIPVSVDGVLNPAQPTSRLDSGQRQRMGIKFFPAIFLVDPKQHTYRPLAYGFITPDDLSRQFLNVATDFKGEF